MQQQRKGPCGSRMGGDYIFNDGEFLFDGVRSVSIGIREKRIVSINVVYEKDGDAHTKVHGKEPEATLEFGPFGKQQGYITTVGGTYKPGTVTAIPTGYISSLYFVTSRATRSQIYGAATGDVDEVPFNFTADVGATQLVGLHGRFGNDLMISIGASFAMPN